MDKLAYDRFHVAVHSLLQPCKNNCHVLNAMHVEYFLKELPCFNGIHLKCRSIESPKSVKFQ